MTAAARVLEHNLLVYRRTWRGSIVSTFLAPVLFLAAMGIGLGRFVDQGTGGGPATLGVPYAVFLAPGLLAAQAMQTAVGESTYPVMGKIRWRRIYDGMLASPIGVRDILAGEFGWLTVRIGIVAVGFFVVMVAFGLVHSPLGLLAVPAAVLTGLAFALPIYAFTVTQYNDAGFAVIFRLIVTPLFLFSGTFFPVEQLPAIVRPVAYATPLFHGVALARGASLGTLEPSAGLLHSAVLLAFIGAGLAVARVTLRRRMVS